MTTTSASISLVFLSLLSTCLQKEMADQMTHMRSICISQVIKSFLQVPTACTFLVVIAMSCNALAGHTQMPWIEADPQHRKNAKVPLNACSG